MPDIARPHALTTHTPFPPCPPGAGRAPPCRAVWLDPSSRLPSSRPPPPDATPCARFTGPVRGAWGGHSPGRGWVRWRSAGFDAELGLESGTGVNAVLRGGGHGIEWVQLDDECAEPGSPFPLRLCLSLAGRLRSPPLARRGWGADSGGDAFIGSEDGERRPLGLRLRLDPQRPGMAMARTHYDISVPNRRWTPLALRFALRVHTSLNHALHWAVIGRLTLLPMAGDVSARNPASGAGLAATARAGPRTPASC